MKKTTLVLSILLAISIFALNSFFIAIPSNDEYRQIILEKNIPENVLSQAQQELFKELVNDRNLTEEEFRDQAGPIVARVNESGDENLASQYARTYMKRMDEFAKP